MIEDSEINVEVYNEYMQAYECTEADEKRQLNDKQIMELCLRVKCRVDMTRWNAVHDYKKFFERENCFPNKSPNKIEKLLTKAVNRHKDIVVYTNDDILPVLKKEKCARKKENLLLLDFWDYQRNHNQNISNSENENISNISMHEPVERNTKHLQADNRNLLNEVSCNTYSPISSLVLQGKSMLKVIENKRNTFSSKITMRKNDPRRLSTLYNQYNLLENTLDQFLSNTEIVTKSNENNSQILNAKSDEIPSSSSQLLNSIDCETDYNIWDPEREDESVLRDFLKMKTNSLDYNTQDILEESVVTSSQTDYRDFDKKITLTSTQSQSET